MKFIIQFVVASLVMLIMDTIWLGGPGKQFYIENIGGMMRMNEQGVQIDYISAAIVYLLMVLGVVLFVVPKANNHLGAAILWGALFGAIVYGVFNYTNLAILRDWTAKIAIIDMSWGIVLFATTSLIVTWVSKYK